MGQPGYESAANDWHCVVCVNKRVHVEGVGCCWPLWNDSKGKVGKVVGKVSIQSEMKM